MNQVRKAVVGLLSAVGVFLVGSGAMADTAALYIPPEETIVAPSQVKLTADRLYGFAPMIVNLSGMVQTHNGDLVPMNGGQQIRIVVESPFLRVHSGTSVSSVMNGRHYESLSAGPGMPAAFHRALEIRRAGTYLFRVQVIAPDGEVLNSNEVSVKVL